jgi:hypothetical protein
MPGEGWVTVSLRKSTGFMHAFYNPASLTGRLHLNRSILALAALLACSSVHADYDAKMEAQEKAKFDAERAATAKRNAAAKQQFDAAQAKGMRDALGQEAQGKSDAQVKVLYDAKIKGYQDQGKKALAGGAPGSDMAKGDAQMKAMTGKSMQDIQKMSPAEQEAFAKQMEKQYGGGAK